MLYRQSLARRRERRTLEVRQNHEVEAQPFRLVNRHHAYHARRFRISHRKTFRKLQKIRDITAPALVKLRRRSHQQPPALSAKRITVDGWPEGS